MIRRWHVSCYHSTKSQAWKCGREQHILNEVANWSKWKTYEVNELLVWGRWFAAATERRKWTVRVHAMCEWASVCVCVSLCVRACLCRLSECVWICVCPCARVCVHCPCVYTYMHMLWFLHALVHEQDEGKGGCKCVSTGFWSVVMLMYNLPPCYLCWQQRDLNNCNELLLNVIVNPLEWITTFWYCVELRSYSLNLKPRSNMSLWNIHLNTNCAHCICYCHILLNFWAVETHYLPCPFPILFDFECFYSHSPAVVWLQQKGW